jgi:hypothetical protein
LPNGSLEKLDLLTKIKTSKEHEKTIYRLPVPNWNRKHGATKTERNTRQKR